MATMLYYPLINPSRGALYQGLIYWDAVASIVPDEYEQHLDSSMTQVDAAGLYRPVRAPQILERSGLMSEGFPTMAALARSSEFEFGTQDEPYVRLVAGKIPYHVEVELQQYGLVDRRGYGDLMMRSSDADALLSIVAREAAAEAYRRYGHLHSEALIPHTDLAWAHRLAHAPISGSERRDSEMCLQLELGNLLPVPAEDVALSDLLRFRESYDDERRAFMRELDRLVHRLRESYSHEEDIRSLISAELMQARQEMKRAAESRGIRFMTRSLWGFVSLGAAYFGLNMTDWQWLSGAVAGVGINLVTSPVRPARTHEPWMSYLSRLDRQPIRIESP